MTRVGYGDLLKVPHARWGKGGSVTWLLRDEFDSGNTTSPRAASPGPGSWTITDASGVMSVAGSNLVFSGLTAAACGAVATALSRSAGLCLLFTVPVHTAVGWQFVGYANGTGISTGTRDFGVGFTSASAFMLTPSSIVLGVGLSTTPTFALVTLNTGGLVLMREDEGAYRLNWVDVSGTTSTLYPRMSVDSSATTGMAYGLMSARQLPAPFDSDYGICSQNVASPVSGTSYTATADAITDLTLTAPNPLADQAGYRYRYTDDDNCWHSYFNSAGDYRLDSVAASVATNRINVAAVIAATNVRTMRTTSNGSLHNAYTLAGTTWTKRGSQINVSHLNTNTAIRPYVTGSWAMSNLRSYPTTDPRYDAELNKT